MKFKGPYNPGTTYDVGDVVAFDNAGFRKVNSCPAGVVPIDNRYFMRIDQQMWDVISMILDAQQTAISAATAAATAVIDSRITEDSIALKTDNGDYLITVDDSGETPELEVTAIEEEAGE